MTLHYDPSAFTSQAAVNGFDAGTNSNFLADCEATIQASWARARYASRESLEYLRALVARIGELSGGRVEVESPRL